MEPVEIVAGLYLGNHSSASEKILEKFSIVAVVNVGAGKEVASVVTKKIRLKDRAEDVKKLREELNGAVAFIESHLQQGHRVLVHCMGCVHRSPTIVCAYLMQSFTYEEALVILLLKRPACRIRPEFKEALLQWQREKVNAPASVRLCAKFKCVV